MKRLLTIITSIALTFALSISATFATDDALVKTQNAIKTIALTSPDAVIGYEAAGLEADGLANDLLENFKSVDYNTASYGDLTKSIIAICLLGDNPADFNKTNLVQILENRVNEDGTLVNDANGGCGATIWTLMALEAVGSSKTQAVAKHLSTMALDNGAYWYLYNGQNADLDTTGWAMEALSVAGRSTYDAAISKAYAYVQSKLDDTGAYNSGWGGNADTQACVLEGIAAAGYKYDEAAYKYLLSYQNEDGTFNGWNGKPSDYTLAEAARSLGAIHNESFILKAKKDYQKTLDATKPEQPSKPDTKPDTTTPEVKPGKDTTTSSSTTTTTTTPSKKETTTKKDVVNTGDDTNIMAYVIVAIAAVGVITLTLKSRKQ